MKKSALILLDLQNDLISGDPTVAVPLGHTVVPIANQIMHQFDLVVATQNWHPKNYIRFVNHTIAANSTKPEHCIQNTSGAELSSALNTSGIHHILHKGTHANIPAYSAFFDHDPYHATGLHTLLKFHKIKKIYILGLSVDDSLEHTALDAIHLGYQVYILLDGCRSLATEPKQDPNYLKLAGTQVKLINSTDLHTIPEQLAFAFYDE